MRLFLICIFLLGLFFHSFSNTKIAPDSTFQDSNLVEVVEKEQSLSFFADSLFKAGRYFEAAIEFERLIYFSYSYRDKNHYRLKKALCYKAKGNYLKAKTILHKVSPVGMSKAESQNLLYEKALVSYLDMDYKSCERALLFIEFDFFDIDKQKNLHLITVLNSIMLQNFKKSEEHALKFASLNLPVSELDAASSTIKKLYSKKELPKTKNDKVFEWISIVPGMGQMYVGEIGEAFTNIGLNLAAFSFGVFQFINGFYFTGYFVATLSINKFYFGGRTRAKNAFKEVNAERLAEYNNQVKEYLLLAK